MLPVLISSSLIIINKMRERGKEGDACVSLGAFLVYESGCDSSENEDFPSFSLFVTAFIQALDCGVKVVAKSDGMPSTARRSSCGPRTGILH